MLRPQSSGSSWESGAESFGRLPSVECRVVRLLIVAHQAARCRSSKRHMLWKWRRWWHALKRWRVRRRVRRRVRQHVRRRVGSCWHLSCRCLRRSLLLVWWQLGWRRRLPCLRNWRLALVKRKLCSYPCRPIARRRLPALLLRLRLLLRLWCCTKSELCEGVAHRWCHVGEHARRVGLELVLLLALRTLAHSGLVIGAYACPLRLRDARRHLSSLFSVQKGCGSRRCRELVRFSRRANDHTLSMGQREDAGSANPLTFDDET